MLRLRPGLNLENLQLPMRQGLQMAARLGFAGVELNARTELPAGEMSQTAIRQVRKWLADLNLRVCLLSYPTQRGYSDPAAIDRRVEGTNRAMKLAYDLGARHVVTRLEMIPTDRESPAYRLLLEVLIDLGAHGLRVGANLAIRTGASSEEVLRDLLGELPEKSIGVDFDPAGLILNGHSPAAAIQVLAPAVVSLRACDAVRDLSQGRGVAVQLGRGSVDFPDLFSVLERNDFDGYVLVEGHAPEPARQAAEAIEYLKSLF